MKRVTALDALRGIAILAMAFSGMIPWKGLGPWMYHAQEPPPAHDLTPTVYGISWVDLVFPVFLFSLGAAIPLSRSQSAWWRPFVRYASLVAFAIAVHSLRPFTVRPEPTLEDWKLALLSFAAIVMAWARFPKNTAEPIVWMVRSAGVFLVIAELASFQYRDGKGFQVYRNDIILLVLANVALLCGLVHQGVSIFLERNPHVRRASAGWLLLPIWGIILGLFAGQGVSPFIASIFNASPYPDLFRGELTKYMLVGLPGMAVGYVLSDQESEPQPWAGLFWLILGALAAACVYWNDKPWAWQLAIPLVAALGLAALDRRPLFGPIWWLGTVGIGLGLFASLAFEGMRKDPGTSAYLLATPGLAALFLGGLTCLRPGNGLLRFLGDVGANPMLGYVAITHLVPAAIRLTGLYDWFGELKPDLTQGVLFACFQTLLVALVCWIATRLKFSLRT